MDIIRGDNITPEGFGRSDNRPKDGWTGSEKGGGGSDTVAGM